MNIGPKMAFILRVYQMTEADHAEDVEHDREMVRAGVMSEREFWKRSSTRSVARNIRRRDDGVSWPRDARKKAEGRVIAAEPRPALRGRCPTLMCSRLATLLPTAVIPKRQD